ncbi:hypothetical protein Micbo1qcDRAFT_237333 [Microdochium bolleyi]|uniref:Xylanolytic transcriptional activator regulatory domain-containing protein n=1 Tax=Microdochium bolleyi TaxID=196109 RepID=A0A136ILN1_9PEZI|nr:hypothetical protein Micbo1qcDRAFT_237333 [Microdochium bolleyi]
MASPVAKRRRIRKGTVSCWECKRRKTRCTYAASESTSISTAAAHASEPRDGRCDGCRSRGTDCISQEFDQPQQTSTDGPPPSSPVLEVTDSSRAASPGFPLSPLPGITAVSSATLHKASPPLALQPLHVASTLHTHADISRALAAVWPSEEALAKAGGVNHSLAVLFHGIICQRYAALFTTLDSSYGMKDFRAALLLPADALHMHPVLLARRLLLLSKYMQAANNNNVANVDQLTEEPATARKDLMSRAFTAATRLVTSNDSLVESSLDGIECVMIEAMYLNNAGSLRRAWRTNRRAMLMAQTMGIHEEIQPSKNQLPVLETATRQRIDPAIMWFRLLATDWYLSLQLGLPPDKTCMIENPGFIRPAVLASLSPLEQIERIMTAVAGRVMLRQQNLRHSQNESISDRIQEMYQDDFALQDAANLLPPQWWEYSAREFVSVSTCTAELQETLRFMNQFAYYQVLMRLHLPHMLSRDDREEHSACYRDRFDAYDYSRTVAANASRSILTLFAAFRASHHAAPAYCRGVDFVVFGACATLCLAHIDTRRRQKLVRQFGWLSQDALQHQRPADRCLLERTIKTMQQAPFVSLGRSDRSKITDADDVVAQKMADVLKPLLAVEEAVAGDAQWEVQLMREPVENLAERHQCEVMETVHVKIADLGTIVLERKKEQGGAGLQQLPKLTSILDVPAALPLMGTAADAWALEGVDLAMFSSMTEGLFTEPELM